MWWKSGVFLCVTDSLFLECHWWNMTRTDYPGPVWGRGGGPHPDFSVCSWINRLFVSCSVSETAGYIAVLQPCGTRPSASGKICTCELSQIKKGANINQLWDWRQRGPAILEQLRSALFCNLWYAQLAGELLAPPNKGNTTILATRMQIFWSMRLESLLIVSHSLWD